MTDTRPTAAESWPEPPTCPGCRTPNLLGASACWLCGADLPTTSAPAPATDPFPIGPVAPATPGAETETQSGHQPEGEGKGKGRGRGAFWPWPRPRMTIGTMMIVIGVVAVSFAVASGKAGMIVGLVLMLLPSLGYLVARVRRVARGEEEATATERAFGELAANVLVLTAAAAVLAALLIVALKLLQAAADSW